MTIPNLGRGGQPVYAPTSATLSIANNSRNAAFSGTAFIATDPTTGAITYPVGVGDILVVSGVGFGIVESVTDASHLVLTHPWAYATQTSITSQGSPGWYIIRNQIPAYGATAKAIQDILAIGSDSSAETTRTWDNGVSRIKVRFTAGGKPEIAVGPTGTADASLVSALQIDPATGAVSLPAGLASSALGLRNRLLNGNFDLWQRGSTKTSAPTGFYLADRWITGVTAGSTFTVSNIAAPAGFRGTNALQIAATALPANNYIYLEQKFESRSVYDLAGGAVTVSFDISASTSAGQVAYLVNLYSNSALDNGDYAVLLSQQGGGVIPAGVSTITATFPASATANIRLGGKVGIYVFQQIVTGNVTYKIGSVQMEPGSIANPFEYMPITTLISLCQRYYQKSYRVDLDPGTAPSFGTSYGRTVDATTNTPSIQALFQTMMRAAPTVHIYSPSSGAQGNMYDFTANADVACSVSSMLGRNGFVAIGSGAVVQLGHLVGIHWTAECEL